jgi:hypothetical protein
LQINLENYESKSIAQFKHEGIQGLSPKGMVPWYADYFKLKSSADAGREDIDSPHLP